MFKFDDETHIYTYQGSVIPSLSEILQTVGITDYSGVSEIVMEAARNFGKAVHKTCEYEDRGTLDIDKLDNNLRPYLTGWKNFCEDYQCDWILIEEPMMSKQWSFGTTPDRIGEVKKRVSSVEIKSTSTLMSSTAIQTAAHALVYNEYAPKGSKVLDRYGVLLLPDGVNERNYKAEKYTKSTHEIVLKSAINVYNWINNPKKGK